MDEDDGNPSKISSGHVNNTLIANIMYLNKKRKFQAEQMGLPLSKHKCCERSFSYECDSPLNESPEAVDFCTHIINGKTEEGASNDGSEPESVEDSNSFATDAESAMSVYGEAKFKPGYAKTWVNDQPSTSSANMGSSSFKKILYSLDSRKAKPISAGREELIFMGGGHNHRQYSGGFQGYEEPLIEFEDHVAFTSSEYGNDNTEQYTEMGLEDMLYSNEGTSNNFVLSSGRWSVNQEAQSGTRKPTIDQEFEQYFSTLML